MFSSQIKRFLADEDGATMIEYALMVALIAIALIVGVRAVGIALQEPFTEAATELQSAS